MSIVESSNSKRTRITRGLAGAAIVSAAAFVAAPKVGHAEIIYGNFGQVTGDQSWFNTANWFETTGSTTGTLPETYSAAATTNAINIDENNATLPAVGVLFDPANDTLTPGGPNANYIAQMGTQANQAMTLYVSHEVGGFSPSTAAGPNKLTIDSGTLEVGVTTVGRDGNGVIVQNGGSFITDNKLAIQGANVTTTIGSGTFEYHGGTYIAGNQVQVGTGNSTTATAIGNTSAGIGRFVSYNNGPDGAILVSNSFGFATNTGDKGTIGIVEFHYDDNLEGVGNTRPVQNDFNTTNGQLTLKNGTNTSSRLNFVLDAVPTVVNGNNQNLGLFKDGSSISGNGTFPKIFYSALSPTTGYTQGATISAAFSGTTYSWTISYSGVITFDNTGTSAYTSGDVAATGGTDVVLVGLPAAVPEPASLAIMGGAASMVLARRRQKKA